MPDSTLDPRRFRGPALVRRSPRRAEVVSPLGTLALEARAGATTFAGVPHAELSDDTGRRLLIWDAPPVRAELLVRPVMPELPAGMRVDGCVAAVWRVGADADGAGEVVFRCAWVDGKAPAPGGPSSGQALAAQTWANAAWTVCVGTPDAEGVLWTWRNDGVSLPAAWRARVDVADPALVMIEEMDDAGITVRLPPLAAGETGQTHFVVAWARTAPDDVSAWFAADIPARVAMGPFSAR